MEFMETSGFSLVSVAEDVKASASIRGPFSRIPKAWKHAVIPQRRDL